MLKAYLRFSLLNLKYSHTLLLYYDDDLMLIHRIIHCYDLKTCLNDVHRKNSNFIYVDLFLSSSILKILLYLNHVFINLFGHYLIC